jgi:hypothetical protein
MIAAETRNSIFNLVLKSAFRILDSGSMIYGWRDPGNSAQLAKGRQMGTVRGKGGYFGGGADQDRTDDLVKNV